MSFVIYADVHYCGARPGVSEGSVKYRAQKKSPSSEKVGKGGSLNLELGDLFFPTQFGLNAEWHNALERDDRRMPFPKQFKKFRLTPFSPRVVTFLRMVYSRKDDAPRETGYADQAVPVLPFSPGQRAR